MPSLFALFLVLAAGPFVERAVKAGDTERPYRVYAPDDLKPDEKLPIVLFLHGAGERGRDGLEPTRVGFGPELVKRSGSVRAIAVIPQIGGRREYWIDANLEYALAALAAAEKEFHADPDRVYLTGLSMGGYGAWTLASLHPERFAAIAIVCGGIRAPWDRSEPTGDPYKETAEKVQKLPVRLYHGNFDRTVPVAESRKMHELLKGLGADVTYVELEGVGHNSWDKAYGDDELWKWLFAQKRGAPTTKQ